MKRSLKRLTALVLLIAEKCHISVSEIEEAMYPGPAWRRTLDTAPPAITILPKAQKTANVKVTPEKRGLELLFDAPDPADKPKRRHKCPSCGKILINRAVSMRCSKCKTAMEMNVIVKGGHGGRKKTAKTDDSGDGDNHTSAALGDHCVHQAGLREFFGVDMRERDRIPSARAAAAVSASQSMD
jgi:predicted RNA-binding Zn-ribbon protein involved in translation (DUF1610 family)